MQQLVELIREAKPNPTRARDLAHHLRTTDIEQRTDGSLGRPGCAMCVLGAIFAFEYPTLDEFELGLVKHVGSWERMLQTALQAENEIPVYPIYAANDDERLTFAQFADVLEEAVR